MRHGKQFICPNCGERCSVPVSCPRCDVPMQDEHGREVAIDRSAKLPKRVLSPAAVGALGGLLALEAGAVALPLGPVAVGVACLGALGATAAVWSVARLAGHVRSRLGARRARRALDDVALTSIGDAADGRVHIRGRVHVLSPIAGPQQSNVGAYLWHRLSDAPCRCADPSCKKSVAMTSIEKACGRFAVVDATGVAVVDDDYLHIASQLPLPPLRDCGILVTEGMVVDVIGPAQRAEARDAMGLLPGGYRTSGAMPLCFDGDADAPVSVVVADPPVVPAPAT